MKYATRHVVYADGYDSEAREARARRARHAESHAHAARQRANARKHERCATRYIPLACARQPSSHARCIAAAAAPPAAVASYMRFDGYRHAHAREYTSRHNKMSIL